MYEVLGPYPHIGEIPLPSMLVVRSTRTPPKYRSTDRACSRGWWPVACHFGKAEASDGEGEGVR